MSASLFAGPPHFGQVVFIKSSHLPKGDFPSGENSTLYGSSTGSCSIGTSTVPHFHNKL